MKDFPRRLAHGSGTTLELDATRLLIELTDADKRSEAEALLERVGFLVEPDEGSERGPERVAAEIVNHTDHHLWVRERSGHAIDDDTYAGLVRSLGELAGWVGPVYDVPDTPGRGGKVCPLPNVLLLRQKRAGGENSRAVNDIAERFGLQEDAERSRYLSGWRIFTVARLDEGNAYQLRDTILGQFGDQVQDVQFETMPMVRDQTFIPNDPLYPQQWGMAQIGAGGGGTTGWDLSTGINTVVVAVIDYGFDLGHPDLAYVAGVNLSTMAALTAENSGTDPHGTACAGIIAARIQNAGGVAGVAGNCSIMPVRRVSGSDVEVATGINWAATNGADVLSMSFGRYAPGEGAAPTGWNFALIDPAIADAVNVSGCVLCAATGNENLGTVNRYPARHALVLACGASDQVDNRKSPASPDGESWGSNFGTNVHLGVTTGVSVVAPGVLIPTTDHQGAAGYNTAAGAAGDYVMTFNGTSSATPHVAGLAALLLSLYPGLTNAQVRNVIERTAAKVGTMAYNEVAGFPNGSRNQEMGYGRINVLSALDFSDVMIRDYPADSGAEPSTPPGGDFWDFSDIVVRPFDDNVFNPSDPTQSNRVERGQTNFIYVRVTNNGPAVARNVTVTTRITPWAGTQFAYPADWTLVDANHISPAPVSATFATLGVGASAIAKFSVSSSDVESLWSWVSGSMWHPCLLAAVTAENDVAFASAPGGVGLQTRRNNLAQRNLTVVDDVLSADVTYPFLVGHRLDQDRVLELVVDRSAFAGSKLKVLLEDDRRFFKPSVHEDVITGSGEPDRQPALEWLERGRIRAFLGGREGVLTLEAGSRLTWERDSRPGRVDVKGGRVALENGRRVVHLTEAVGVIRMEKDPGAVLPIVLETRIPTEAKPGVPLTLKVAQRDERGAVTGGVSATYIPAKGR